MLTLSAKRIIGLVLFALGLGLILLPFHSVLADLNDPAVQYGYAVTRNDPATFAPANGNQRLELKKMADIERASKPTVHFDATVKSNYMCDWAYDKVLGRYVCEKNYLKAYQYTHPKPIPICPFGYKLDYGGSNCVRILYPQNAHLSSQGNGWECNPGFHLNMTQSVCLGPENVYRQCPGGPGGCGSKPCTAIIRPVMAATPIFVQQIVQVFTAPERLPSTGPSGLILLFGLSVLAARKLLKKA